MEWKPIDENTPKDRPILVVNNSERTFNLDAYAIAVVCWNKYSYVEEGGQWCLQWDTYWGNTIFNPTHWMPLPELPKEE